jgi:hypothetical protein
LYISGESGENTQAENREEMYIAKKALTFSFLVLICFLSIFFLRFLNQREVRGRDLLFSYLMPPEK